MSDCKLKPGKIGTAVEGAYKKVEDTVVGAYKKVEDTVVGAYKKVEDAFVDTFLEKVEEKPTGEASAEAPMEIPVVSEEEQ